MLKRKNKHKRPKVYRTYLERRLYKTERHIERLVDEATAIRKAMQLMDEQTARVKAEQEKAVNEALHDVAIKSAPIKKGEMKDASNS